MLLCQRSPKIRTNEEHTLLDKTVNYGILHKIIDFYLWWTNIFVIFERCKSLKIKQDESCPHIQTE